MWSPHIKDPALGQNSHLRRSVSSTPTRSVSCIGYFMTGCSTARRRSAAPRCRHRSGGQRRGVDGDLDGAAALLVGDGANASCHSRQPEAWVSMPVRSTRPAAPGRGSARCRACGRPRPPRRRTRWTDPADLLEVERLHSHGRGRGHRSSRASPRLEHPDLDLERLGLADRVVGDVDAARVAHREPVEALHRRLEHAAGPRRQLLDHLLRVPSRTTLWAPSLRGERRLGVEAGDDRRPRRRGRGPAGSRPRTTRGPRRPTRGPARRAAAGGG